MGTHRRSLVSKTRHGPRLVYLIVYCCYLSAISHAGSRALWKQRPARRHCSFRIRITVLSGSTVLPGPGFIIFSACPLDLSAWAGLLLSKPAHIAASLLGRSSPELAFTSRPESSICDWMIMGHCKWPL